MAQLSKQCLVCKHFFRNKEGLTCKAFPEAIPYEILTGEFRHTKKHPEQDNKILFELKDK